MRNCSELYFGEKRQWRKHQGLNVCSICCCDNEKYRHFAWKADNILKLYPPFSLKTRKLRFYRISCFFFLMNVINNDPCVIRTGAPPCGRRFGAIGCHRAAQINSDRKMAELRKDCPVYMPCRFNYSRKPSFQGKLFILLCILTVDSGGATTHWVVTEDGKIQQQVWWLTLV